MAEPCLIGCPIFFFFIFTRVLEIMHPGTMWALLRGDSFHILVVYLPIHSSLFLSLTSFFTPQNHLSGNEAVIYLEYSQEARALMSVTACSFHFVCKTVHRSHVTCRWLQPFHHPSIGRTHAFRSIQPSLSFSLSLSSLFLCLIYFVNTSRAVAWKCVHTEHESTI